MAAGASPPSMAERGALEATAGALLLPGLVHRLRNLLFRAGLPGTPGPHGAGRHRLQQPEETARAVEEIRALLDLVGGGLEGGGSPWVEGAGRSLARIAECLGGAVRARGLAVQCDAVVAGTGEGLPPLRVPPPRLLLWAALALRHVLDGVPDGVRGTVRLGASAAATEAEVRMAVSFHPAPGYLPLRLAPQALPSRAAEAAAHEGILLEVAEGAEVLLRVPLSRESPLPPG